MNNDDKNIKKIDIKTFLNGELVKGGGPEGLKTGKWIFLPPPLKIFFIVLKYPRGGLKIDQGRGKILCARTCQYLPTYSANSSILR